MLVRRSSFAALAAGSLVLIAGQAVPALATTAPGASATIPVTVTNTTIHVAPDKFTLKSAPNVARYPRGVTINFKIKNNGSVSSVLTLKLLTKLHVYGASHLKATESTKPIPPKGTAKLSATFAFRGDYEFELVQGGKIVAKNAIVVF